MRVGLLVVTALLAMNLSGCGPADNSLTDDGAPGQFGFPHVHVGDRVWFALPSLDNHTDRPVRLIDIRLADTPPQVKVLRYRGQSASSVGWKQLGYRDPGNAAENPLNTPEVKITDIVAPPHGRADGYVMMQVQLLRAQRVEMTHVLVTYEVAGHVHEQRLGMDLVIEPA